MRLQTQTRYEKFHDGYIAEPNTGCWLWIVSLNDLGYGMIWDKGKTYRAHRVSYEIHKGEIPTGLELHHTCETPCCVNPDHLIAVTHQVNMIFSRNANRLKTNCKNGHKFDTRNTYCYKETNRQCLTCARNRQREKRVSLGFTMRVFKTNRSKYDC